MPVQTYPIDIIASPENVLVEPRRMQLSAVLMRAGTSKGLFLNLADLPEDRSQWGAIILGAMGSPDPYLKQLDGMGGGVSTQSKVAVICPSARPDADVDYLFIQVPVNGTKLDFSGNCGNISSGVGPYAVEEGMVPVKDKSRHDMTVRIYNVNTGAIIHSTFTVHGKLPVEYGTTLIDGVQPAGSPVKLDFLDPAGAMTGTLLPTGSVVDTFTVRGMEYEVSCVDSANPFVFIAASGLGLTGAETGDALLDKTEVLMDIRAQASMRMGLTTDMTEARAKMGTPKIAIVSSSISYVTASGRNISGEDIHISVRPFSMGLPHPTLQMTGAICIASACAIPGTVTNRCVKARLPDEPLIIGHGGGMLATSSSICLDPSTGKVEVKSGSVFRTARRLMKGQVMYLTR